MGRFWQGVAAVCALLAVFFFIRSNHYRKLYLARPVIPTVPLTTKPDTTSNRPDTVKWVPPELRAKLTAWQARVEAFRADSAQRVAACESLLAEADTVIDSLNKRLSEPPEVTLTLSDSTLPYLLPTVSYRGFGTQGVSRWSYRFISEKWPREEKPPGRGVGRVGVAVAAGWGSLPRDSIFTRTSLRGKVEAIIRVKQNTLLKVEKNIGEEGWWGGIGYFFL